MTQPHVQTTPHKPPLSAEQRAIKCLWELTGESPALREQAQALLGQHAGYDHDPAQAQAFISGLKALLGGHWQPQAASSPVSTSPITALGGLLRPLGSLSVVISKDQDGELLTLTVLPEPFPGETADLTQPFQIRGAAEQIDQGFAEALGHYRQARNKVFEYSQDLLAQAEAAIQANKEAKAAAERKANEATLTVTVTQADGEALKDLHLQLVQETPGQAPVTLALSSGTAVNVNPGKYTLTVGAEGQETVTRELTLKKKAKLTETVELTRAAMSSLF